MRRALVAFVVLAALAACSTSRVVFGTVDDSTDVADASSDAGDASDGSANDQCPVITLARTFVSADRLLAALEGYWRICGGTLLWDAPPGTIGIAVISSNAYFAAPSSAGTNVVDPASRRHLSAPHFETGMIEYRTDAVDLVMADDGNSFTLHHRRLDVTVAFVRTNASFR